MKTQNDNPSILSGKYLGQKAPGIKPELFAPNVISTGMDELNAVFSPDFKAFYYTINLNNHFTIITSQYDGNTWSEPTVAGFSGKYSDADPFISKDGKWLYFISKRPVHPTDSIKKDWDIWRSEKINGKWADPHHLDRINSESDDSYPCLTDLGTLYFSSERKGSVGGKDIYYAKQNGNDFEKPIRVDGTVNDYFESDTYVSPNEDYMIFVSLNRPEGNGLYISFFDQGKWTDPKNMGKEINFTGWEYCPILSPDGKYFFFTSSKKINPHEITEKLTFEKIKNSFSNDPQMGKGDIYWVDVKVLDAYH